MEELGSLYSEGELALVVSGVTDNFRLDGRTCLDMRQINVRTGTVPSCNGSSQVHSANCNISVGIKVEVGPPNLEEPDCGLVEFNVDCSPISSPKFVRRFSDEVAKEVATVLSNALIPTIDRTSLCISKGHKVWVIYVDVLILDCSCIAQLFDLAAIGVKAALHNTSVPKLTPDEEDANDFVLSPDNEEYCPIDTSNFPLLLTLTRIHDQYVVDVTEEEAAAGISRLTLAFDSAGGLVYTRKSGSGSLHTDPLKEILPKASKLAIEMHRRLNNQLVAADSSHNKCT